MGCVPNFSRPATSVGRIQQHPIFAHPWTSWRPAGRSRSCRPARAASGAAQAASCGRWRVVPPGLEGHSLRAPMPRLPRAGTAAWSPTRKIGAERCLELAGSEGGEPQRRAAPLDAAFWFSTNGTDTEDAPQGASPLLKDWEKRRCGKWGKSGKRRCFAMKLCAFSPAIIDRHAHAAIRVKPRSPFATRGSTN